VRERTGHQAVAGLIGVLAALVVITATACGSGGDTAGTGAAGGGDGAAVYAARCASCHGSDLGGTSKGPSHLSKVYEPSHHSDASFRRAITQGSPQHHWNFGDMPPVPGMSEADITAVIAYVRTQQQARGFKD
jgi:mono/diheme cytochrome c family protein